MVTEQIYFIIALVTAHFVGDFLFQTSSDVKNKNNNWIFTKHIFIITFLSYLFVGIWTNWLIPLIIAVTHTVIDLTKLNSNYVERNNLIAFFIDQFAHLLVIGLIAFTTGDELAAESFWLKIMGAVYLEFNIYISGLIFTVFTGGIIVGMLVKPFLDQIQVNNDGLEKGGELIGKLERLLIFFFVVIGNITVVGFLIAAKSIFRFGELKDSENRKQAEYILIGTLYSFSWAFILSWLTQKITEVV